MRIITTLAAALASAFACSASLPATAAGAPYEGARPVQQAATADTAQHATRSDAAQAARSEQARHAARHARAGHASRDGSGLEAAKEATGREAVAAERSAHMPVPKTNM